MHFGFDEDDDAIRDAVRSMLRAACPPSVVRDAWTAPPGALARDVWDQLVDMGVPALLVPEDEGGLGLDDRSLVQVLEEIGYAGVPLPVVESVVLAPTLGLPVGPLTATDLGGPHVPMAADADRLLLRGPGAAIHLVAPSDAVITPLASTDGARRLAEVRWVAADSTVACDDPDVVARAMDRGTVATAAVLVGLLRRLLDMTVQHVRDRHQFGVPIGSFQAVKHHLADGLMRLEFARPAVHRASWSLATHDPLATRHVSLAKLLANEAAQVVTRQVLQCHGAIGYTVEYDLHLYLKRAWALAAEWGDAVDHRARLARSLGLTAATASG